MEEQVNASTNVWDSAPVAPKKRGLSVVKKIIYISIVGFVLWLASLFVFALVEDRTTYRDKASESVEAAWGGVRSVGDVYISIPYSYEDTDKKVVKTFIKVVPSEYSANTVTEGNILRKGIYKSPVYIANIDLSGHFDWGSVYKLNIDHSRLELGKAKILFSLGLSVGDSTGTLTLGGKVLEPYYEKNALVADLNLEEMEDKAMDFNFSMSLRGSRQVRVKAAGVNNSISIQGDHKTPSFTDSFSPSFREVGGDGYQARWNVNYSHVGYGAKASIGNNSMDHDFVSVEYLSPDTYTKVNKALKYAILVILLTFAGAFLADLWAGGRINIFQYILIGMSLVLFYSLLLSFSERMGFSGGYILASVMTIVLDSVFFSAASESRKAGLWIAILLSTLYSFTYILLNLEENAMLIGNIGLFIILAAVMFISLKFKSLKTE